MTATLGVVGAYDRRGLISLPAPLRDRCHAEREVDIPGGVMYSTVQQYSVQWVRYSEFGKYRDDQGL